MPFTIGSQTLLNSLLMAEIAICCSEKLNSSARKFAVFEPRRARLANKIGWEELACYLQLSEVKICLERVPRKL
jgi:hypothetical protein